MATTSFNHKPASTTVRTASYTIPAGRYARVVANVIGSGAFTIGGVVALQGTQNSVISSDNLTVVAQQGTVAGGGQINIGGLLGTNTSNSLNSVNGGGTAFNEATQQHNLVESYWVPEGTVINGSGTWRAVVEEYVG